MPIEVSLQTPAAPPAPDTAVPWERVERFFNHLSHDIRNGLNACELQLTFLAEITPDPDAGTEIKQLRATLAGITRQLQSIRASTGKVSAHLLEYPAGELIEDLRERLERLHPEVATFVTWETSVDPKIAVLIDPELVLSSCLELLKNAAYFSDGSRPIVCQSRTEDGRVTLAFQNHLGEAPILPLEDWGHSPFQSTRRGAYGLGLFQARRAFAAQSARLDFHYAAETKLLSATVALPIAMSPALT